MNRLILPMVAALFVAGTAGMATAEDLGSDDDDGVIAGEILQEEPEKFIGETVVIAGVIDAVAADGATMEMRLVTRPFDDLDLPDEGDEGCFLAVGPLNVDPRRLYRGRSVTVVGVVEGVEDDDQGCPVVRITQLDLVERPEGEGRTAGGRSPAPGARVPYPWYYRQPQYPYPLFNPNYPPAYIPVSPHHHAVVLPDLTPLGFLFLPETPGQGGGGR